jgi:exodeoxyribonuclease V alpha subunit
MSLADLRERGLIDLLDLELARALGRMTGSPNQDVELAIALTSRNVRRGHTCFPVGMSAADVWPRDAVPPDALPDTERWKDALTNSRLTQEGPLVLDSVGRLYLRRYWQLEQDIAEELAARSAIPPATIGDLDASLGRLFPGAPDSPQRRAAHNALNHRVSLLCGGPGTGKTTTVASIAALIIEARLRETGALPRVALLAPTGKSAARLGEAVRQAKSRIQASAEVLEQIPEHAMTMHRALGMQREGMRFRRNADFPLDADVVVVDEASMIDLGLMRQLLHATSREATLLIVGDPDQLTSVEAGSVLRDLVSASTETWWHGRVTHLSKTYRYDEKQALGRLVAAIRDGEAATVAALLEDEEADDVTWASLESLQPELDRAAKHWCNVLRTRMPQEHFDLRGGFVVPSPFRRGPVGTRQLGAAIRDRLPGLNGGALNTTPIIIEENSHELRVYNGDFAMLIDGEPPTAVVQSDTGEPRRIAEARLPRFSDAFALSVHKAQGSEFDEVLIVLPEQDAPMLTRELLYTAVSRARKRVRVVGPQSTVAAALGRRAQRHSGLQDAIRNAIRNPS